MSETKEYLLIKTLQPTGAYLEDMRSRDSRSIESEVLLSVPGTIIEKVELTEEEAEDRRSDARPHVERVVVEGYGEIPPEPEVSADAVRVTGEEARRLHRIPEVWALGFQGQGVTIGVSDTGITKEQADRLKAKGLLAYVESTVPGEDPYDDAKGHGPWVIECIHAIAPKARIGSVKCLSAESGSGSSSGIIKADSIHKERGALDVNKSLGGSGQSTDPMARSTTALRQAGVLCPCAAGNEQRGKTSFTADGHVPGNSPGACCTGAVDSGFEAGEFSSWGKSVDCAAIGVLVEAGGVYMSGTSMATPFVAGIIALGLSTGKGFDLVETAFYASCRDTGLEAYKEGHGIADALGMIEKLVGAGPAPKPEPTTFPRSSVTKFFNDTPEFYYKDGTIYSKFGPEWKLTAVPGKVRK